MEGLLIPTMIFQNTDKAMEWVTTEYAFWTHLGVHAQLVFGDARLVWVKPERR